MKRGLLFLLLLNYINTTMFFPVIEETGMSEDAMGYYDETNSIIEFVKKEVFGKTDRHTDDEDQDQPLAPVLKNITVSAVVLTEEIKPIFGLSRPSISHHSIDGASPVRAGFLSRFSPPPDPNRA